MNSTVNRLRLKILPWDICNTMKTQSRPLDLKMHPLFPLTVVISTHGSTFCSCVTGPEEAIFGWSHGKSLNDIGIGEVYNVKLQLRTWDETWRIEWLTAKPRIILIWWPLHMPHQLLWPCISVESGVVCTGFWGVNFGSEVYVFTLSYCIFCTIHVITCLSTFNTKSLGEWKTGMEYWNDLWPWNPVKIMMRS